MTPQSMTASSFTPQQHAVLFGLLAQSISAHFPGQAAILLRKAVEAYGMERGQRMAARCLQNGDALDMIAYDAYGELPHFAGSERTQLDADCAFVSYRVTRCPWCDAWQAHGLAAYGAYYCRSVDAAILRGFNPALTLNLPTRLSDPGSDGCRFEWQSAPNTPDRGQRIQAIRQRLNGSQTRSFAYHTAHLLQTVLRVVREADAQKAPLVEQEVREGFSRLFEETAWQCVEGERHADFSAI